MPPTELTLSADEVHVWRAALDPVVARNADFHRMLSDQERLRASRFHLERDRQRYIVRHAILRILLARYLGVEPCEISYRAGVFGKPSLRDEINPIQLRFNFSHSHQLALYAFSRAREIGVDLEYVRPIENLRDVAAKIFSQNEKVLLSTLPDEQVLQAFYHCWTRKEAYLKATGKGLYLPLDRFEVSLTPGEPARLLSVPDDPQEVDRWQLQELSPERGYVAALAVEGFDTRWRFWQWK